MEQKVDKTASEETNKLIMHKLGEADERTC